MLIINLLNQSIYLRQKHFNTSNVNNQQSLNVARLMYNRYFNTSNVNNQQKFVKSLAFFFISIHQMLIINDFFEIGEGVVVFKFQYIKC